ncbi:four helix bundle protein [Alistipes putredinis]|uniref:four helix bundle protein n=2 Tax=Alistipes putredinis TaxID=28117 RepID=UPI003119345E
MYAFYLRSEKNALYIRKVVAQYDNLPVYKAAYDLLQSIYRDMGNVPRDVKFTLVETLKNELTEILVLIYKANSTTEKLPLIMDMRERLVGVKVRLRLLHDLRHVGTKLYAHLVEQVEAVSKQLASWQKYVKGHTSESEGGGSQ